MIYLIHNLMIITWETWVGLLIWTLIVGSVAWMNIRKTGWTWRNVVPLLFLALVGACGAAIVNPAFLSARVARERGTIYQVKRVVERLSEWESETDFNLDVERDLEERDSVRTPYALWRPLLQGRHIEGRGQLLSVGPDENRADREIAVVRFRLVGRGAPETLRVTAISESDVWKIAEIRRD